MNVLLGADHPFHNPNENDLDYVNSTLSFPQKLFALLEQDNSGVVIWAPHGYCFKIVDADKFAKEIVPKYFKQTKLTSFQRQLNLYGFRRLAKGEDQGAYFHPKFQRNRKDLLGDIKRLPAKGTLPTYEQVINAANYASELGKRKINEEMGADYNSMKKAFFMNPHPAAPYTLDQLRRQIEFQQYDPNSYTYPPSKLSLNVGYGHFIPNFRDYPGYNGTNQGFFYQANNGGLPNAYFIPSQIPISSNFSYEGNYVTTPNIERNRNVFSDPPNAPPVSSSLPNPVAPLTSTSISSSVPTKPSVIMTNTNIKQEEFSYPVTAKNVMLAAQIHPSHINSFVPRPTHEEFDLLDIFNCNSPSATPRNLSEINLASKHINNDTQYHSETTSEDHDFHDDYIPSFDEAMSSIHPEK